MCYVLAAIGDASLVGGVIFLGSDFADNLGVGDFLLALSWDFVVSDGEEVWCLLRAWHCGDQC